MATFKEHLQEKFLQYFKQDHYIPNTNTNQKAIIEAVKDWLDENRPKKQSKNNVWTSTEYEQEAFIKELLEKLEPPSEDSCLK